jgi:carboxypeptidase family protein/TonB-dependent receptor-like protein
MKVSTVVLALILIAAGTARGQGVGASGTIQGTVTDQTGGAIANASIVALEISKGVRHTATTDASGAYQFTSLVPDTYSVTATESGFQTQVQQNVVVTTGGFTLIDFHMQLATATTQVEVTAAPPTVETERGSEANTLTQQYIENLPIDRRDYLTFTLLLPGVSNSTRLADDQDFRVKQTPQSGLSFYGSNGRGNSVTVDGGEAQDDAGGVRLTISQDGVQEFQVNRSNYSADLGGASGASINIVTKSGTNDLHGTAYSYFRNSAMDARDPFAFNSALQPGAVFDPAAADSVGTPIKNSLARYQYGGSVGLPIRKDKTFLFASFEGLLQDSQNSVPLLTNTDIFRPTAAQQGIINTLSAAGATPVTCFNGGGMIASGPVTTPGTCAFDLNAGLTVSQLTGLSAGQNALNSYLVNQFESNGGVFSYNTREYLASGRLDHHMNDANQFSLTYRYGHDLEENPDVQSLTGFSAGSSTHNYDDNLLGAWYHEFSATAQNELRLQWDYDSFDVIPNEPAQAGLQIPGFANNLGTNIFLPSFSILRRYELADNLTLIRGHHTLKFGGSELLRGNHTDSHTFFPGRFVFGQLPGALISPTLASTSLDSLQAASFGLPQVYQQGFGTSDYPAYTRPLTGLYAQDSWAILPNLTLNYGLRYEIDSQYLPLNTYYKDFAPRLSFAWDPFKDHKTVVRAGYGIFYGPIDAQIPGVDLSLGVLNKNRSTVENQNNTAQIPNQVNNVVGTCGIDFPPGNPVAPFVGTGASPCTRFISIYVDPITPTPFSPFLQTSNEVFQELFAAGLIQCTTPTAGNKACITPASLGPGGINSGIFPTNGGPLGPLQVIFSNPPNYRPPIAQQASVGIEREISPGFTISLSGIYSHTQHLPVALDTNLLPAPLTNVTLANGKVVSYRNWNGCIPGNPNSCPADPLGGTEFPGGLSSCANPFACFVNPLIVQNNQYTAASSALYEGGILEIKKRFGNHYTVFGNYTYSKGFDTGTDFNSDYGPQDPTNLNLDRGLSEFDERHKVVIAGVLDSPWKETILNGFQLSPIFTYTSGHPFNLLAGGEVNGDNHTTNERPIGAPRDSGLGPNLIALDARLTWQHKLTEKVNLQITAEGFNIANRTNFASVNNEVSPLFGLVGANGVPFTTFNVHGIRPGTVLPGGAVTSSSPLAFTSDLPKREIQLGARFVF